MTLMRVPGLSGEHQGVLDHLMAQLQARSARNRLRRRYYDHEAGLRDLGIAIPPTLRDVETVVGWPAKAVDSLSRRTVLDGFTLPGGDVDTLGLGQVWADNRLDLEAPQAHTSALIHSCAFVAVTAGDVVAGEPEVLITARSAQHATGLWDARARRVAAYLSIVSVDEVGIPDYLSLILPDVAVTMRRSGAGWDIRQSPHDLGYVPVEVLAFNPELDKPFGKSRISRPVMALTDSAVRTLLRSEVSAEFYSAPQRYILGAEDRAFKNEAGEAIPAWQAMLGKVLTLSNSDDGSTPQVGQFAQQSMQPHFEQLRGLAAMFAAEASLPLDSLGIVHDNPSSAEAIARAKEDLVIEAKHWMLSLAPAWERTAVTALSMLDSRPAATAEYARIRAHWRNPATPSPVSAADALVKQAAVFPWLGETEVGLEMAGFDADQRARLLADKRRSQNGAAAAALLATAQAQEPEVVVSGEPV